TQRPAGYKLAGDVHRAVEFLQRIDCCDAGMGEGGGDLGFLPQTLSLLRARSDMRVQRLQRDASAQTRIVREVHDTHSAAPQLVAEDVGAYHLPGDRRVDG